MASRRQYRSSQELIEAVDRDIRERHNRAQAISIANAAERRERERVQQERRPRHH